MEQARVAVCHAFGFDYKRQVSSLLPYGIYTIPEVSCVGLAEEEAKEQGIDVVVGRAFYRDNARGKIIGDSDGMVKLVFDRATRKLIGCHCIGDRASELVHMGRPPSRSAARSTPSSRWSSTTRRSPRSSSTRPTTRWAGWMDSEA